MQTVENEMETIHLYVVREHERKPYTVLPLLCALFCLAGIAALTLYSAEHPYYEHERLSVPAQFLPPQMFQATQVIIPTGIKTYPATTAHGVLTFANGSVIGQSIPAGFTVQNVTTDAAVYVPAGSADGYGFATVQAHVVSTGLNLPTLAVNTVVGSSLYIRNLSPFTDGHPSYSLKFITSNDRNVALSKIRNVLNSKIVGLHAPCQENHIYSVDKMVVTWRCRFVQPPHINLPNAQITGVKLSGKNLLVDVAFIAPPVLVRTK
jgi:hypothetical protein